MSTWRRSTSTPPGGRVRDQHELVIRAGRDRAGAGLGVELDGRAIGRPAAAWVLARWRTGRRRGAALWVTRSGTGTDPGTRRGGVLWVPRYGQDDDVTKGEG